MLKISEADLVINADGSVYHLNILPEDVADTIITVGDPDRISEVTKHFDRIELKKGKREFLTHTGYIGNKRITVVSTGIGTDNIDIVLNELDALVNIDFNTRLINPVLKSLNIIRIGTSGTVQRDIETGTIIASAYAIGLDTLMHYYKPKANGEKPAILDNILTHFAGIPGVSPYVAAANKGLIDTIGNGLEHGITVTAPGFYAPQGRQVRAINAVPNFIARLSSFRYNDQRITNLEMETAGIYALSEILGHKALSINAILANRINNNFSKEPNIVVEKAIKLVLGRITA